MAAVLVLPARAGAQNAAAQTPQFWLTEAERLKESDPARTVALAERAIAALSGGPDDASLLQAHRLRCWAALAARPDSMLAWAQQGMQAAARSRNAHGRARIYVCRGYALDAAGQPAAAIEDYDFVLSEAKRLRSDSLRAEALVLRGEVHYYRGEFTTAIAELREAYTLFVKLNDEVQQRYALNAMANLFADGRVGQYEKALEYYRRLLVEHQKAGSQLGLAESHYNIASTLEQQNKLQEALVEYRRGLAIDEARNDPDEVAIDQRAIGVVLYKLNRPADALVMFDRALARFRKSGNPEDIARGRLSRGVALRMLGRFQEAVVELNAAHDHFSSTDNKRFLEKVEEQRALAFGSAGNWRGAYDARVAQLAFQKDLDEHNRNEQTAILRVQFEAQQKEQENRALLRDNAASARIRQLQLAVLALSAAVIAVLALFVYRQLQQARGLRITAMTDELTRLPNRRHLLHVADEQFKVARAAGSGLGVLAFDADHFKRINDTYGHAAGDVVLQRTGRALQSTLRGGDVVGRTGGEEFIAILPGASKQHTDDVANRVRESIETIDFSDIHPDLCVTVSVGAAVLEASDASFADIMKRADDSLYTAKALGRNRVEVGAGNAPAV
jgi:diguanylate cyclase (GGDEF)-like protein